MGASEDASPKRKNDASHQKGYRQPSCELLQHIGCGGAEKGFSGIAAERGTEAAAFAFLNQHDEAGKGAKQDKKSDRRQLKKHQHGITD